MSTIKHSDTNKRGKLWCKKSDDFLNNLIISTLMIIFGLRVHKLRNNELRNEKDKMGKYFSQEGVNTLLFLVKKYWKLIENEKTDAVADKQ